MQVNAETLRSANVAFNAAFAQGIAMAPPVYDRIATTINSTTKSNEYGWLGKFPKFREWVGDRVINSLKVHGYTLTNRSFEQTLGVDRDDFDDDNLGIYTPLFQQLGMDAQMFPNDLVFALLKAAWETKCYDGKAMCALDHPVLDAEGRTIEVANTDGGAGAPWFLMDTSRPLKPLIFQNRKPFTNLVRQDQETDANVFSRKEYVYGTDGRCQVGFGFWQMMWGSKQMLDVDHYETARTALTEMKGDYDKALAITPNLLVVPPSLEGAARRIVASVLVNGGESNPWANTAEILVAPWLA